MIRIQIANHTTVSDIKALELAQAVIKHVNSNSIRRESGGQGMLHSDGVLVSVTKFNSGNWNISLKEEL